MLRTRVLTALVLLPAAFYLVFMVSPTVFAWVAGALVLVGSWEFRQLADIRGQLAGWLLVPLQAALLWWLLANWGQWAPAPVSLFALACLLWVLMFSRLLRFRPGLPPSPAYRVSSFFVALASLSIGWMALVWLRHEPAGQWWLLALLVTVWAADIGAYFAGRAFGGAKLAPTISPGKTRAGLYGGLLAGSVAPLATVMLVPELQAPAWQLLVLGLVTSLVSVGGDLLISLHKRTVGCKDTGKIFPGHGGVLDRLDSLLAAAPFFVLGKLLAGF
jgi:phosphatidate cytidylyltransferase